MTHPLLVAPQDCDPARVGGKAAGLAWLAGLGLEVPAFVVLSAAAAEAAPVELSAALAEAWRILGGGPLAVRSSGLDEDGAGASFAGQHETVLGVVDAAALPAAVAQVLSSGQGERALAYRRQHGLGSPPRLAVVLQRLVAPEAAGVAFSVDPATGRDEHLVVSALWGLGEGLVSGRLDADTWTCDFRGQVLACRLAAKTVRVVAAPSGGTCDEAVEPERVQAPCLDAVALAAVCRATCRIAEAAGCAQDVEFALVDGRPVILQARPVTAVADADGLAGPMIYDNANIGESYPGVTLPLTFSFIRRAYRAVYWQFCRLLGLREGEIRRRDGMLANMLAQAHGRVYYQLLNWYRLVALLPGFAHNRRFMEGMMGVRADLVEGPPPPGVRPPSAWRLLTTGLSALRLHRRLPGDVRVFHRHMAAVLAAHRRRDLAALDPAGLIAVQHGLERDVLWRWQAPIVNDFAAMIFNGLARRLAAAWGLDREGWMVNALISGQGRIESTEVSRRLVELAAICRADPALAAALADDAGGWAALRAHPQAGPLAAEFLAGYGDRCAEELKLESVGLREEPQRLAGLLRRYQGLDLDDHGAVRRRDLQRQALRALQRLPGRCLGGLLARRRVLTWAVVQARRAVRNRENQRIERTRGFALVRQVMRELGRRWQADGQLRRADDIFLLILEEVEAAAAGRTPVPLRELVRRRAQRLARDRARPDPADRLAIGLAAPAAAPTTSDDGALRGLGAFPGVVEARAAVLEAPDPARVAGRPILVARSTDPGWVVVFPAIAGLVCERGSMLSHGAIVARELGIPAAVGVAGAMARIADGARIRLDGGAGTVEVIP